MRIVELARPDWGVSLVVDSSNIASLYGIGDGLAGANSCWLILESRGTFIDSNR